MVADVTDGHDTEYPHCSAKDDDDNDDNDDDDDDDDVHN